MTRFMSLGGINPEHLTSSPVLRMRRNCFASPKRLDRPRTVEPKLDEESVAAHPVHSSSSRGNPKIPEGRARTVTTPEGVRDSGGTSERRLQPTSSFFKGRMEDLRPPTHRVHATPMALVVGPSLAAGCLLTGMPPRLTEAPVLPRTAPSLRRAPPNPGFPNLGVSHGSCRVAPGRTSPVVANHRPRPKAAGRPAKEVSNHVTTRRQLREHPICSARFPCNKNEGDRRSETLLRHIAAERHRCRKTSLPKDIAATQALPTRLEPLGHRRSRASFPKDLAGDPTEPRPSPQPESWQRARKLNTGPKTECPIHPKADSPSITADEPRVVRLHGRPARRRRRPSTFHLRRRFVRGPASEPPTVRPHRHRPSELVWLEREHRLAVRNDES